MITEDYVSFETAKLLKEKGFDEPCALSHFDLDAYKKWFETAPRPITLDAESEKPFRYPVPSIYVAMKWLREVYNLVIEPYRTACGYLYTVSTVPYGSTKYDNSESFNGDDEDSGQWTTWEKACEDGIEYCLKNLI